MPWYTTADARRDAARQAALKQQARLLDKAQTSNPLTRQGQHAVSDYFEGLKLAKKIGVPCKDCATASIWCAVCAAKWRKACEEQKRAEQNAGK